MGRLNKVIVMGRIEDTPAIKVDNGEYVIATIQLLTARRSYRNEKGNLAGSVRSDIQQIVTRNPYIIEHWITNLQKGDMIMCLGSLSTRDIVRTAICPHCGERAEQMLGVKVYIDPTTIMKLWSAEDYTPEEIIQYLTEYAELSNMALFFGTLVREPRYAPDYGVNRRELALQVAANRRRFIKEDGPSKRTDYPHVRVFGSAAEEGRLVLHTGSEIYIDGAVETREVELRRVCPCCEENFFIHNVAVEIVPYSIEYIEGVDVSLLAHSGEDRSDYGKRIQEEDDGTVREEKIPEAIYEDEEIEEPEEEDSKEQGKPDSDEGYDYGANFTEEE